MVSSYSEEEIATITTMLARGAKIGDVAAALARPPVSLGKKVKRLGLRVAPVRKEPAPPESAAREWQVIKPVRLDLIAPRDAPKIERWPYSDAEIGAIRDMFYRGEKLEEIARQLNRPVVSLGRKMRQLGLRAKPARGVRIIQPATLSHSPEPPDFEAHPVAPVALPEPSPIAGPPPVTRFSRAPRYISGRSPPPQSQHQHFSKNELREMLAEAIRNTR